MDGFEHGNNIALARQSSIIKAEVLFAMIQRDMSKLIFKKNLCYEIDDVPFTNESLQKLQDDLKNIGLHSNFFLSGYEYKNSYIQATTTDVYRGDDADRTDSQSLQLTVRIIAKYCFGVALFAEDLPQLGERIF